MKQFVLTTILLAFVATFSSFAQVDTVVRVQFNQGEASALLEHVATAIENGWELMYVEGFTSVEGSTRFNNNLATARARFVAEAFGFTHFAGMGETVRFGNCHAANRVVLVHMTRHDRVELEQQNEIIITLSKDSFYRFPQDTSFGQRIILLDTTNCEIDSLWQEAAADEIRQAVDSARRDTIATPTPMFAAVDGVDFTITTCSCKVVADYAIYQENEYQATRQAWLDSVATKGDRDSLRNELAETHRKWAKAERAFKDCQRVAKHGNTEQVTTQATFKRPNLFFTASLEELHNGKTLHFKVTTKKVTTKKSTHKKKTRRFRVKKPAHKRGLAGVVVAVCPRCSCKGWFQKLF